MRDLRYTSQGCLSVRPYFYYCHCASTHYHFARIRRMDGYHHGYLWRVVRYRGKKKKLFYVLSDLALLAYKSERSYITRSSRPIEIFPLYDLAALSVVEHPPDPPKCSRYFFIQTSQGVFRVK